MGGDNNIFSNIQENAVQSSFRDASTIDDFADDDRHGQDPEEEDATPRPTPIRTHTPTHLPSLSNDPTLSILVVPIHVPTGYPTFPVAIIPSQLPMLSSTNPTDYLLKRPTSLPSNSDLTDSSLNPSSSISSFPTLNPTWFGPTLSSISPSNYISSNYPSSSTILCEHNIISGGEFGDTSGSAFFLSYDYETETDPLSDASMDEEVVPRLESAMLIYLSIQFYPLECADGTRLLDLGSGKIDGLVGMSTCPPDIVLSRSCTSVLDESYDCTRIKGQMSLFLSLEQNSSPLESEFIESLKYGMINDEFIHAHPSLKKVIFVQSEKHESLDDSNDMIVIGVCVPIALLALIFIFIVILRRKRQKSFHDYDDRNLDVFLNLDNITPWEEVNTIEKDSFKIYDEMTVKATNRGDGTEILIPSIDTRARSDVRQKDALFDFFDLILENSSATAGGIRTRSQFSDIDDLSEISF